MSHNGGTVVVPLKRHVVSRFHEKRARENSAASFLAVICVGIESAETDQEHVAAMLQLSERLHKAHRIKDDFLQVLDCDTGEAAEQTLDLWLSLARNSGLKEFEACCDTIEEWKAEILHSFDCPYTNGYTEGCNNRIKVLKRNAYGYRNFGRFRNRILHMFSGSYRRRETEKAAQNGQP